MIASLRHVPWNLVCVTAGVAIVDHGFRPLAGYLALRVGASATQVALLAAAFAVGALLLAIPTGRLVDRIGAGKVLALASIAAPLPLIGALFVRDVFGLLVVAIGFGCIQILLVVSSQAAVASRTGERHLDVAFGWLSAGTSIGQVLGPLIALAIPQLFASTIDAGLHLLLILSCVVSIGAVLSGVAIARRSAMPPRTHRPTPIVHMLRIPGLTTAVSLSGVTLACLDLMVVFLPLWAEERGIGPETVALLLGIRGVMSLLSRVTMHALVTRFARKPLITTGLAAGAVGMAVLPFIGADAAYAVMAVFGFALGLVQPLTMTWVVSVVLPRDRGAALGLRMLANRLMQVSLPVLISAVAVPLGAFGTPATRSLLLSASSLVVSSVVSMRASWRERGDDASP